MMGNQCDLQPELFYHRINLEQRVPQNHILRKIEEKIDFDRRPPRLRGEPQPPERKGLHFFCGFDERRDIKAIGNRIS